MMNNGKSEKIILSVLSIVAFSGCGGGGGGDTAPAPAVPPEIPAPTPTPVVIAPEISALVPSKVFVQIDPAKTRTTELSFGESLVGLKSTADGSGALTYKDPAGTLSIDRNSVTGVAIFKDSASQTTVLTEPGPKGTVFRLYNIRGAYVKGFYVENGSNGSRTLYDLIKDGTTDLTNLTNRRSFSSTPLPLLKASSAVNIAAPGGASTSRTVLLATVAAASDGCYDMMASTADAGARATSDMGEVLGQDGNPVEYKRAGGVARVISRAWGGWVSTACPDAPDPKSDSTYQRELAQEVMKAVGGSTLQQFIEKFESGQALAGLEKKALALHEFMLKLTEPERLAAGAPTLSPPRYTQV